MKPILIRHMRHDLTPAQRASLSGYEIVEIDSHETSHVNPLWFEIGKATGGRLPEVIQTTWRGVPLRKLLISTYSPRLRHPDGRRVQVIKAVMCIAAPDRWSGEWREWVCDPDLDEIEPGKSFEVRMIPHWKPETRR